jgi:hypothetical protein
MARIDWDLQKYDGEFKAAGMERMVKAAEAIRDVAKQNCKVGTVTRPARRYVILDHKRVPVGGTDVWTERSPGAMSDTIRVVRLWDESKDISKPENVRVYAGDFKTWWAVQMEYGRGAWKGGPKPFLRPALHSSEGRVRAIIEGR